MIKVLNEMFVNREGKMFLCKDDNFFSTHYLSHVNSYLII